ncbi:MAG: glycosyltransferase family 1 protein, partial [Armatimonadota bacterium]|nr:glycosyltransferase family 1 protein [Armatimonadota bacterium]
MTRIAYNGRVLLFPTTGVAKRLLALSSRIARRPGVECLAYVQRPVSPPGGEHFRYRVVRFPIEAIWAEYLVPRQLAREGVSLYHSPWSGGLSAALKPCPYVLTLHDLIPLEAGALRNALRRAGYLRRIAANVAQADVVIAVSRYVRDSLLRYFPQAHGKVEVIYNGVDPALRLPDHASAREAWHRQVGGDYLLYVGGFGRRKNVETLLRAFAACGLEELRLVLVGHQNRYYRRFLAPLIRQLGIGERVVAPGYEPEERLAAYYTFARALVYPSLHEGFGMPPVEAMACGCPAVTHNASALPEVTAGAALMVNAADLTALTQAIRTVATEEDVRQSLIERGKEVAAR